MSLLFCFFPIMIPTLRYDIPRWLQLVVTVVSLTGMFILSCAYGVFSFYLYKDFGQYEASRVLSFVYIVVVVSWVGAALIYQFRKHDLYEEAYHDALYSSLLRSAKYRYRSCEKVVVVYLPQDEYDRIMDQYSAS